MAKRDKSNRAWHSSHNASFILGMALATLSPLLMAAYCWSPDAATQAVSQGLTELDAAVIGKINKQTLGYTTTITDNTAVINEAIKVAVSQEALAATQIAKADRDAKQLEVAALAAQKTSDNYIDVQLDYGSTTGQGYNVCQVYAQNAQLNSAMDRANAQAAAKVYDTDNAPGRIIAKDVKPLAQRDAKHKTMFCSTEEVNSGVCEEVSLVPSGDSNANVLFISSEPNTVISAAKTAFRQNVLGEPVLTIPKSVAGSAIGQVYLANVNRKTALSAFSAYSLAYLEAMSEKREDLKDAKGNPQSPNDMMLNTVTRYYGGSEAKQWTKSMLGQQPRGLLVELAKMEGLGAYMDNQEYLANQRLEGNIAAMTILATLPMEDVLVRQEQQIRKKHLASKIKASSNQ